MMGFCKHGDELSGSIKTKFLDQMINYKLFK